MNDGLNHGHGFFPKILVLLLVLGSLQPLRADPGAEIESVFDQDIQRCTQLLDSPVPERRIEGLRGISYYKYFPAEGRVIQRLQDTDEEVRREALLALCRLGGAASVPHLIQALRQPAWEFRQNAWLALSRMTAQTLPAASKRWSEWWQTGILEEKTQALLAVVKGTPPTPAVKRHDALLALKHLADGSVEGPLLAWLQAGPQPPLDGEERELIGELLERVGTARAIPVLAGLYSDAAPWALGRIGGPAAEQVLLAFPKTLPVLLNLDRLKSTNTGPFIPHLVASMGLVTYRGHPDDLMNPEAQPIQRVGAQLIRRSGYAPVLTELVLQELEDSMKPPIPHGPRPAAPARWDSMLAVMREELKPGFVRNDGVTTSQPLTALYQVAVDPALAPRLVPLLKHPAFVPRVYVAMLLGKLHAAEALPALVEIIREGYAFSDSTALASGKHFDQSQTVRWRGFLCMALGRLGGEQARQALETFAADEQQSRDIRYGAVVGLGFIGSPKSIPVLRQVAQKDVIWMVRDEARRAAAEIELLSGEKRS